MARRPRRCKARNARTETCSAEFRYFPENDWDEYSCCNLDCVTGSYVAFRRVLRVQSMGLGGCAIVYSYEDFGMQMRYTLIYHLIEPG